MFFNVAEFIHFNIMNIKHFLLINYITTLTAKKIKTLV